MILRELVAKLGFQIDSTKLNEFEKSIDKVHVKLKNFSETASKVQGVVSTIAKVASVTAGAITALSVSVANSIKDAAQQAEQLNVNVNTLRELENAAQNTGVKVGALSDSFIKFSKYVGEARNSAVGTTKELRNLGVSLFSANGSKKNITEVYSEASRKIIALKDANKQVAYSQKLFGTTSLELVKFMGQSSEALTKQREEVRALTYELDGNAIKASSEFITAWSNFKTIIDNVKTSLGVKFLPILTKVLTGFKEWFKVNKLIINSGLSTAVNILVIAFKALYYAAKGIYTVISTLLTPVTKLIEFLGGLEKAIVIIGSGLAVVLLPEIATLISVLATVTKAAWAFTASLLANPATWIAAALLAISVAVGLLIEDFYQFATDNTSVIGAVLSKWTGFEVKFKDIVKGIKSFFINTFESMISWFTGAFDGILNTISKIKNLIGGTKSDINNIEIKKQIDPIQEARKLGNRSIKTINLSELKKIEDSNNIASNVESNVSKQAILTPVLVPEASNVSNTSNLSKSNINQNITGNITVNVPAGTTQEQSTSIAEQVDKQMQEFFSYNMLMGIDSLTAR